jgi:primase-polymerase (primpol)-like protein
MSIGFKGRHYRASVLEPGTWLAFDVACAAADLRGWGVGYVLSADDPFTCIDFDVKNANNAPDDPDAWTSALDLGRMRMLVEDLDSYTELSQSGQGVHVWVLGNIGPGIKRNGVELYSRERFIACTGKRVNDLPIQDRQAELDQIVGAIRAAMPPELATDAQQVEEDDEVMRRFWYAKNAERFRALWFGDMRAYWNDHSRADQALVTQLAFYTPNNDQLVRLWHASALGQRPKAHREDYIDRTVACARAAHAPRLRTFAALAEAMGPALDVALAAHRR